MDISFDFPYSHDARQDFDYCEEKNYISEEEQAHLDLLSEIHASNSIVFDCLRKKLKTLEKVLSDTSEMTEHRKGLIKAMKSDIQEWEFKFKQFFSDEAIFDKYTLEEYEIATLND